MSVANVNATSPTSFVGGSSGTGSLQLMFAQLQLEQADLAKEDATAYLDKIKAGQVAQQECSEMISRATALMEQADTEDKVVEMPLDMVNYFQDHDITFDHNGDDKDPYNIKDQHGNWIDVGHTKEEWEFNIENLSSYRDQLGTTTQTDMVYVEDFMGQYNSYLTGANSTIDSGNQTLQTIMS